MRVTVLGFVLAGLVTLAGCSKSTTPASGQTAIVNLKDGSTFSGSVTKSDTSSITLVAANGESRTYPMSQVSGVQYVPAETSVTTTAPPSASVPASSAGSAPVQSAPPPVAETAAPVAAEPPPPPVHIIPAGSTVSVRNSDTISANSAVDGQTFPGVVTQDVIGTDGQVAIPRGSDATLVIRGATDQGKMKGQSELAIDVASVRVHGKRYNLDTHDLVEKGKEGVGANKRTGIFTGGGAVLGTVIGAVAGGGKGAAIGAASGAAAGLGTQALTRGKAVSIPAETVLSFKLDSPVHIHLSN
jgi:hypothetical protein